MLRYVNMVMTSLFDILVIPTGKCKTKTRATLYWQPAYFIHYEVLQGSRGSRSYRVAMLK